MTHVYRLSRRLSSTLRGHQFGRGHPIRRVAQVAPALETSTHSNQEQQRRAELEQDLQMARDIQQGLLLAAVPYVRGWELTAVSNPARDLGGDLYDFVPLADGWQGIMIGDVSGKGLPAALRMAVARTMFRYQARQNDSPAQTLAAVNQGVCNDIPQGMVTMLYIMLHPEKGMLRIANAGHTYPLLLNGRVSELELSGVPLGVVPDIDYEEATLQMEPGNSLFLYTDGITEATNPRQEMFGSDKLNMLLETYNQHKPRALMRVLLHEIRSWSVDQVQDDDITMVVFRRRFDYLSDELRSIAADVLGEERAERFWTEHVVGQQLLPLREISPDDWADFILPGLTTTVRSVFNRGLARELGQQFRLAIEDYRAASE